MNKQFPQTKPQWFTRRFFAMTIGSSCFLAYSFMVASGDMARHLGYGFTSIPAMFLYLAILLVFLALAKQLDKSGLRKAISLINIGLSIIWGSVVMTASFNSTAVDPLVQMAVSMIGLGMNSILLVQWNLHFTLNKVENLGIIIWTSMLFVLILLLLFLNTGFDLPLPILCLLPIISCSLCYWIETRVNTNPDSSFSIEKTEESDRQLSNIQISPTKTRRLFFLSRLLWGLAYGIAFTLIMNAQGSPESSRILVIALLLLVVACIAIGAFISRSRPFPMYLLSIVPVLISLILFSLFMDASVMFLARLAGGIAWLVWYTQSYIQLPSYRHMTNMNIVRFAYLEKLCPLIPWAIVTIALMAVEQNFEVFADYAFYIDLGIIYFMFALVIVSTIAIIRHIILYYPHSLGNHFANKGTTLSHCVDQVAEEHGLTPREKEVFSLLAHGYSRPYIEKALFISTGTAKTHVFHIYQKLGINSQDELLELVNPRSSEQES